MVQEPQTHAAKITRCHHGKNISKRYAEAARWRLGGREQTLNEYPDLTGIGLTLGERMGGMTSEQRRDWIDRTLIAGLKAADRKARLIYRAPLSANKGSGGSVSVTTEQLTRQAIETMGMDDPVWIEFKFNWSHGHSSPRLSIVHGGMLTDTYWDPYSDKYKAIWTMRNEDFFVLRWAQPDFIREFIRLNSQPYAGGCFIGSECYIPAKDFITVGEEWAKPYKDKVDREILADYYGMIANIDHNFGLLRQRLKELDLEDNTILIFMTDNGTYVGAKFSGNDSEPVAGFNAGMRGRKSSVFDGGHRVPFFIRWPNGGLEGGRDINTLSVHVDLFPTLAELCGIPLPTDRVMDGKSLAPLLKGDKKSLDRDHVVLQFHGGAAFPEDRLKQEFCYILTERWRLLHGRELYDMKSDPAQREDVSAEYPEVVKELWSHYEPYWESVVTGMEAVRLDLGNPTQNPVELCSQDWYMPRGNPPWNFRLIGKLPRVTAPWMVDIKKAGWYRLTLRQFPARANKPVRAARAKVQIAGLEKECAVEPGSMGVVFEMNLPAGETELLTYLYDEKGKAGGAYFTEVEAIAKFKQEAEKSSAIHPL